MEVNPTDRPDDEGEAQESTIPADYVANDTVPEDETPLKVEEEEEEDMTPFTVDEFKDTAEEVAATVRDGVLFPIYRGARRLMRGVRSGADEFFSGTTGTKKGK